MAEKKKVNIKEEKEQLFESLLSLLWLIHPIIS